MTKTRRPLPTHPPGTRPGPNPNRPHRTTPHRASRTAREPPNPQGPSQQLPEEGTTPAPRPATPNPTAATRTRRSAKTTGLHQPNRPRQDSTRAGTGIHGCSERRRPRPQPPPGPPAHPRQDPARPRRDPTTPRAHWPGPQSTPPPASEGTATETTDAAPVQPRRAAPPPSRGKGPHGALRERQGLTHPRQDLGKARTAERRCGERRLPGPRAGRTQRRQAINSHPGPSRSAPPPAEPGSQAPAAAHATRHTHAAPDAAHRRHCESGKPSPDHEPEGRTARPRPGRPRHTPSHRAQEATPAGRPGPQHPATATRRRHEHRARGPQHRDNARQPPGPGHVGPPPPRRGRAARSAAGAAGLRPPTRPGQDLAPGRSGREACSGPHRRAGGTTRSQRRRAPRTRPGTEQDTPPRAMWRSLPPGAHAETPRVPRSACGARWRVAAVRACRVAGRGVAPRCDAAGRGVAPCRGTVRAIVSTCYGGARRVSCGWRNTVSEAKDGTPHTGRHRVPAAPNQAAPPPPPE